MESLKESFVLYTKNNSKVINKHSVGEALRNVGVIVDESALNKELANLDDFISFEQFASIHEQHKLNQAPSDFLSIFSILDKDDTGLIPINELKYMLVNVGAGMDIEQVEELIEASSVEVKDGKLDYKQFIQLLHN